MIAENKTDHTKRRKSEKGYGGIVFSLYKGGNPNNKNQQTNEVIGNLYDVLTRERLG